MRRIPLLFHYSYHIQNYIVQRRLQSFDKLCVRWRESHGYVPITHQNNHDQRIFRFLEAHRLLQNLIVTAFPALWHILPWQTTKIQSFLTTSSDS